MLFSRTAVLIACFLATPALAIEQYDAHLGPAPLNDAMQPFMAGHGLITVTRDGNKLNFSGSFDGLRAAPINARLLQGAGIGIPDANAKVADLTVSGDSSKGSLTGTVTLTSAQQKALRTGKLYITVGSEKFPDGNGMIWGWVLPMHERVAEDEPQKGPWFQPNDDVPKK